MFVECSPYRRGRNQEVNSESWFIIQFLLLLLTLSSYRSQLLLPRLPYTLSNHWDFPKPTFLSHTKRILTAYSGNISSSFSEQIMVSHLPSLFIWNISHEIALPHQMSTSGQCHLVQSLRCSPWVHEVFFPSAKEPETLRQSHSSVLGPGMVKVWLRATAEPHNR